MSELLVMFSSITAIVSGYYSAPLGWLLLIGLGYFFPTCLKKYNEIMSAIEREKIGLATIYFVWIYVASLIGVGLNYMIGKGISSLM